MSEAVSCFSYKILKLFKSWRYDNSWIDEGNPWRKFRVL